MGRIILAWALFALPVVADAATYYTDTAGSDANSCATAATAASDRTKAKLTLGGSAGSGGVSCLSSAGDTLLVGNGTYDIPTAGISVSTGGTLGSPITLKSENQHLAILRMNNVNSQGIQTNNSYITIDGFKFIAGTYGGAPSASAYVIRCFEQTIPHVGGPTDTGYVGCHMKNNDIDNIANFSGGVKSNQDSTIIENNTIHMGAELFNNLGSIIRNNVIYSGVPGGFQGGGLVAKGGVRDCQLYNNTVHMENTGDIGVAVGGNSINTYVWDTSTGLEAYNCAVYNNVVYSGVGYVTQALGFIGAKDSTLSNNVIVDGGIYVDKAGAVPNPQPFPDNPTWLNNISYGNGSACRGGFWALSSSTGTVTVDYNNFYNCTTAPTQTHAITGDPLFVNPASDWHLQNGSPGLEAGTTVTVAKYAGGSIDVSLDRDGYVRRAQWDLGIYEDDRGAGEPIMFISFAWLLFGIAVVAGGALVVNGVQIIAGKVPGLWHAALNGSRAWLRRRALRLAWLSLMRAQGQEMSEKQDVAKPVDAGREKGK